MFRRLLGCLAFAVACLTVAGAAAASSADVQTTWRLLDYLAVDYSGAVQGGKVVSASEYAEMREFSASVREKLGALPDKAEKPALVAAGDHLKAAIERKASPKEVADIAHRLGSDLLRAYPVNDRDDWLYEDPGPNPPRKAQGVKLDKRRQFPENVIHGSEEVQCEA